MHVELKITDKCSRKRNIRSTCSFCSDSCQSGAFSPKQKSIEIEPGQCTSCGDCLISCPLSAIEGIAITREFEKDSLIYKDVYTPTEKELLIYKNRGLNTIKINESSLNQAWKRVLDETNTMLNKLDQGPIEVVKKDSSEKFSRRAFFATIQSGGKKIAKSMTPASWKMEANEWNLATYYPDYQFYTVEIDKNKCTLCKACFTFCSQQVFHLQDSFLQIEADKCVNCTDCSDICPEDAIQINAVIKKKSDLYEPIDTKVCLDCGQSFQSFYLDAEKCPICVNRNPDWLSPYK
jgi:heterodisulfide reductase subunit A-like polyferredoxin